MSFQNDDSGIEFDDNGAPILDHRIRERLRTQERQLKEAEAKIAEAELRGVYAELQIPNEGSGKFFRENYRGPTDLASVRAAASDARVLPEQQVQQPQDPQQPPQNQQPSERELELQRELEAIRVANGGTSTLGQQPESSLSEMVAKLRAAKTTEEYDAILGSDEMQRLGNQQITSLN